MLHARHCKQYGVRLDRPALFQVDEQDFDVGGCDTGDSAGLAKGLRPDLLKLLLGFLAERAERCVVEAVRDFFAFHPLVPVDGFVLFLDVTFVLHIHLNGVGDIGGKRRKRQVLPGGFRPLEKLFQCDTVDAHPDELFLELGDKPSFVLITLPPLV